MLEIHRILERRDSVKSAGDILREYSQVTSDAEPAEGQDDQTTKPTEELKTFREQLKGEENRSS